MGDSNTCHCPAEEHEGSIDCHWASYDCDILADRSSLPLPCVVPANARLITPRDQCLWALSQLYCTRLDYDMLEYQSLRKTTSINLPTNELSVMGFGLYRSKYRYFQLGCTPQVRSCSWCSSTESAQWRRSVRHAIKPSLVGFRAGFHCNADRCRDLEHQHREALAKEQPTSSESTSGTRPQETTLGGKKRKSLYENRQRVRTRRPRTTKRGLSYDGRVNELDEILANLPSPGEYRELDLPKYSVAKLKRRLKVDCPRTHLCIYLNENFQEDYWYRG